ncbi:hypothetical protein P368_16700 [Comamonas thiooxydans]|nr:hypothetical protein P365_17670 [Comamonas thiooxydans]KGH10051.1 hypothetical protein P368_16700 [Comamonas thiooxydans]
MLVRVAVEKVLLVVVWMWLRKIWMEPIIVCNKIFQ